MLYGENLHSLDAKGRVNFPSRLRERLGARFFITKGLKNCLFVYSEEDWQELERKIRALPMSKAHPLQLFFFAGAVDVVPDKQGRVLIPNNLRDYAMLDKEVMIVGASNHAEIWDKDRYLEITGQITPEQIEQAVDDIGF